MQAATARHVSYLRRAAGITCRLAAHAVPITTGSSLARAVRPIPITLVTVGKGSSKGAELMAEEWADKLKRYASLTQTQIKPNPKNAKETAVAVQHEGERVLKALQPSDHVVLLDERGRDLSSEDLAKLLAQASDQSWPSVVFLHRRTFWPRSGRQGAGQRHNSVVQDGAEPSGGQGGASRTAVPRMDDTSGRAVPSLSWHEL